MQRRAAQEERHTGGARGWHSRAQAGQEVLFALALALSVAETSLLQPSNCQRTLPRARVLSTTSRDVAGSPSPGTACTGERVVVVGATGYIGRAVVAEAARRGYPTTAVVRSLRTSTSQFSRLSGVDVMQADVCDQASLESSEGPLAPGAAGVVICCLASRQGTVRDAEAIDYGATLNCVRAAQASGCRLFVLLSAICVRSAERGEENALQFQVSSSAA